MTDHDPSGLTRALVLAGPALALLATVFCLLTGTGLRFPPWRLVRCGPLELRHRARARPVAGVPPWGLVRLQSP